MNSEKDILRSRTENLVLSVGKKGYTKFFGFIDEQQVLQVQAVLKELLYDKYLFFGGTTDSSRVMLGVFPEFIKPQEQLFPIKALKIKYSKNYELNHRDFLGSLMALQIKREVIGDIVVSEDCAVVFVREDIAQFIITNLKKIGNVGVSVDFCDGTQVVKKQEFTQIKGTVSSMRLDCIVSLLMNKSRTNAVSAINARMVKVNANECENVSFTVKEHDVIAIKGYGKFIVKEEITKTKKGKLFISVDKYL